MERWEYFTAVLGPGHDQRAVAERNQYLNNLGNDGWELISVVPLRTQAHSQAQEHEGFFGGEYQNQETSSSITLYEVFFRRRKPNY